MFPLGPFKSWMPGACSGVPACVNLCNSGHIWQAAVQTPQRTAGNDTVAVQERVGTTFNVVDSLAGATIGILCAGLSPYDAFNELAELMDFVAALVRGSSSNYMTISSEDAPKRHFLFRACPWPQMTLHTCKNGSACIHEAWFSPRYRQHLPWVPLKPISNPTLTECTL